MTVVREEELTAEEQARIDAEAGEPEHEPGSDPDAEVPDPDVDLDLADDEPEPEPEPDPDEPEAVTPTRSEQEMEKAFKKLDAETNRHTARLSEIMGEDALALEPCALCEPSMQGFHWPAEMIPDDDPRKVILTLLSAGNETTYKHPARYATCPDCDGHGKVLTGSREANNVTKVCPNSRCNGAGYIDSGTDNGRVAPTGNGEQTPGPLTASDLPELDFLNRPRNHPNYGKYPQYMTDDEKALDTRDGFSGF